MFITRYCDRSHNLFRNDLVFHKPRVAPGLTSYELRVISNRRKHLTCNSLGEFPTDARHRTIVSATYVG